MPISNVRSLLTRIVDTPEGMGSDARWSLRSISSGVSRLRAISLFLNISVGVEISMTQRLGTFCCKERISLREPLAMTFTP